MVSPHCSHQKSWKFCQGNNWRQKILYICFWDFLRQGKFSKPHAYRRNRHIACRLLISLKMIPGCLLLFFKPSKVAVLSQKKVYLEFQMEMHKTSMDSICCLPPYLFETCWPHKFHTAIILKTTLINDYITQNQQHACHECLRRWFFILFNLLVNYLSCTPVIKNKKHNCRLDLMEMVLWLLSVQETLVIYIISNYKVCVAFFITYN